MGYVGKWLTSFPSEGHDLVTQRSRGCSIVSSDPHFISGELPKTGDCKFIRGCPFHGCKLLREKIAGKIIGIGRFRPRNYITEKWTIPRVSQRWLVNHQIKLIIYIVDIYKHLPATSQSALPLLRVELEHSAEVPWELKI
jgi:hypothetical protein